MTISSIVVKNLLSIYKSGEVLLQLNECSLEVDGAICVLKTTNLFQSYTSYHYRCTAIL